ncbi:hypothetical protein TWF696_003107 [Orbilia brochopaga]|uniref:Uncharacterized protein n=1 Tax=Orbilia brochopaga TaxID=3140254 RepID=A0AAV9U1X9_9PEZI
MISIKGPAQASPASKANILPCHIKYTGPASSSRHLWNPLSRESQAEDGKPAVETHTAYFRGRKLAGTKLVVPDGYQGRVLTAPTQSQPPLTASQKRELLYQDDEQDDDNEEIEEIAQWTSTSSFSEIMVWGHETLVDGTQDGVVKGIEEWMGVSQILNGYDGKRS